jgi:hypothetical protein
MDDRRQFGRRSAVLLTGLVAACILATGAAVLLHPRQFTDHQEEIAYILRQRGVVYEQVTLSQTWRDTQNFYAYADYAIYGADVIINMPDGKIAYGRIECRVKRTKCSLSVGKLAIINLPLPELVSEDPQGWLAWIKHNVPSFTWPGWPVSSATSPSGP